MIARRAAALVIAVALAATGCSIDPEIELTGPAGEPSEPDATPSPTPDGTIPPTTTPDVGPAPDDDSGASGRLDPPDPGRPADPATLSALTGFDRVDCDAFELDDLAGPPPSCGVLSVPETWEDPDPATTVRIPVVVFASTGDPAGDPVVYLEGGPGGHAVETVGFSYDVLVEPYRATRDVIVYDQRGAGLATPSLQCDEVLELAVDLLDDDLDPDETAAAQAGAETACRDRLLDDGVDLSAYHSVASAHDLESLRLALGYERWNVLGISYGTRLAQSYVRMYPDRTRSLVLDSIVPIAADPASVFAPNAARAFEALFETCDALDGCAEAHPDLKSRYFALVDALDDEPVTVEATDNLTGETYDAVVDGEALLQITFGALYSRVLFAAIPELVAELEEGRTSLLSSFASVEVTNLGFVSIGMLLSVECHEEIAFGDPADIDASLPGDPYYDRFADSANARLLYETCERWQAAAAPPVENEPVESDVPTLLMGGRLDPITPPSAIDEVAAGFTRSHPVLFAWEGHGPGAGACGASIIASFFEDPTTAPDDDCADDEPPAFVRRPVGELTLRPVEVSGSGLGSLESLAPAEWDAQGLGVWARSDSLADPSLIAQFAFPFPVDPDSTLGLTLRSFGIAGEPEAREPLETAGGRTWNRWRVDTDGAAWDIAISDDIVIVVAAYPDEIDEVLAELAGVYEAATAG